jgi:single-stranded DNA-binding protein
MNTIVVVGRIVREVELQTKGDITIAKTAIARDRSCKSKTADFIEN